MARRIRHTYRGLAVRVVAPILDRRVPSLDPASCWWRMGGIARSASLRGSTLEVASPFEGGANARVVELRSYPPMRE